MGSRSKSTGTGRKAAFLPASMQNHTAGMTFIVTKLTKFVNHPEPQVPEMNIRNFSDASIFSKYKHLKLFWAIQSDGMPIALLFFKV